MYGAFVVPLHSEIPGKSTHYFPQINEDSDQVTEQ